MRNLAIWTQLTVVLSLVLYVGTAASADKPKSGKGKDDIKDAVDKDYASELPRIPRVSPAAAIKTFKIQPGFRIEQVASEPIVTDPTAMAFDENGVLFVVEMRGYSEDGDKNLGVIRRLVDNDGDGRFDISSVYVDNLAWPTAVACYDGGVFVGVAPDILYCKDTDGDGRADQREVVFSGFGRGNVQGLLNSFNWGLDNRLHGATSSSGGNVKMVRHPDAKPVSFGGRDFAIEPRSMTIAATSGGAQHGASFDRWGNKFLCSNSDHAQLVMYDDRYIARNPYLKAPRSRRSIAAEGGQATVYRISPLEPWRVVRTRLRVKGLVPGPVEGGGTPAGYFTGSTGVTIYRGNAFPPEYQGNLFVADCGSNLVHRKLLTPDGVGQIARRADKDREFLASRDIWFRPVQHANAPDGTLYVADMSREVIEHPKSIPPMIKKHVDLTSGRDQGRIYRIVPDGFKQPKLPRLSESSTAELVALLAHPNGWHRDTASRLLYERQDRAAIEPLEKLAAGAESPEGRMHALYALDGLSALEPGVVLARLDDPHPRVRQHAVKLTERLAAESPKLRAKLYRMVEDDDLNVRYQLAFSLGAFRSRGRNAALAAIARRDGGDAWVRLAVMSSLVEGAGDVLSLLAADESFRSSKTGMAILEALAAQIGAQNKSNDVAALLKVLPAIPQSEKPLSQAILRGVTRGAGSKNKALAAQLASATGGRADQLLDELIADGLKIAADEKQNAKKRAEAVRSLGLGRYEKVGEPLAGLIDYRQPHEVQLAALATLGSFDTPSVAQVLLKRFASLSPRLRGEALETVFSRPQWIAALLDALESKQFAPADIDAARVQLLLAHPDKSIRQRAEELLGGTRLSGRRDVVEAYRDALRLTGDAERGRMHFRKVCASCHRLENHGHEIGKNLASIRNKGPETILLNVLDPNREVDPKYVSYIALTDDGKSYTGIIAAESATSVTLKRAENATDTLLRIDIEALKSSGKSIMPEGLEKQINKQAMADVIAYLMSIK